jgi:putative tricarboxylic transport membrane protein
MWENILLGIGHTLSVYNLAALVFGSLVGLVVGILPGMGPMVGMVVLLPFTFHMPDDVALSMLLAIFCGGYFGGGVPAVLMRIPGVPSSLFTSFDGYPLTERGESQLGLSAILVGSFSGGVISVVVLVFLAPLLAHVAASFGPPEYFCAALLGVVLVIMASRERIAQGLILLGLGFWLATVGIDGPTLVPRFAFGTMALQNGFQIAPVCLGLFGVGQALMLLEQSILQSTSSLKLSRRTLDFSKIRVVLKYWRTIFRSGFIGTFMGLLPGPGSILASFFSYEAAKRASRRPEDFGRGTPEGCLASEAGNNAVPAGAMIPLLTLGIPGDAISALLLGVFTINGIYPGPLLLVKEPVLINELYFSLLLINIACFLILALWLRGLAMIVRMSNALLAVLIMVTSLVGIYSINGHIFDVEVAIAMGVLGYILLRLQWPVVALVMGLVLGDILEDRLRQSLSISLGDPLIFFKRPISLAIMIAAILIIMVPLIRQRQKRDSMTSPST